MEGLGFVGLLGTPFEFYAGAALLGLLVLSTWLGRILDRTVSEPAKMEAHKAEHRKAA